MSSIAPGSRQLIRPLAECKARAAALEDERAPFGFPAGAIGGDGGFWLELDPTPTPGSPNQWSYWGRLKLYLGANQFVEPPEGQGWEGPAFNAMESLNASGGTFGNGVDAEDLCAGEELLPIGPCHVRAWFEVNCNTLEREAVFAVPNEVKRSCNPGGTP